MSGPKRFLFRMVFFLVIVAAVAAALYPQLHAAFMANALFNGMILGVLLLGVIYIFRQVVMLNPEIQWLDRLKRETQGGLRVPQTLSSEQAPRLLGPMARMMGDRGGRLSLSTVSMRTLLDSIQIRIEESHEISRYLIGLLIFLGLLGTFWGLSTAVQSIAEAISGISANAQEPTELFQAIWGGIQPTMQGMGTAFSSSLFGLSGSLVLGFLELQAGQAHNRFLNDLEEWLSGVTKLSSGGPVGDGEQSVPAYIQALLENTADSLDQLQRTLARGEESRAASNASLAALTERLSSLTDHMRSEQSMLLRLSETQNSLKNLLTKFSEEGAMGGGGLDEASRNHLRNLDVRIERLADELARGRDSTVQEIRDEIRLLTRTIAALAEESEHS